MTDTPYTPGPWRIDETIHKDQPHIVSELGSFIADTDRHNAHLIAASPEMLDALTKAFCLVRELQTGKPVVGELVDWANDTLELITKATGQ